MNMLVQPAPLPEEMDRGYLGRVMRINGYRSPKDMVDAMAAHFGEEGRSRREVTTQRVPPSARCGRVRTEPAVVHLHS